ncbi:OmpL47-type beta-barrel domain-containing protein [Arthrobacter sp. D2-10]
MISTARPWRARVACLAAVSALGASFVGIATPATAAVPPDEKLILHYDFESIAGGVVKDSSANGLHGTLVRPQAAGIAKGPDGSSALDLPGGAANSTTAAYVDIPNGVFKGQDAITSSVWTRWDGGADFQWIYNLGRDNTAAQFISPSFGGSELRSNIKPVNGNKEVGVGNGQKLPTGQWVNLVTVMDGSSIIFYANGIEVGREKAEIDLDATFYRTNNPRSGYLGRAFWSHPYYDGQIDEFRIYSGALTPQEVSDLYTQEYDGETPMPTSLLQKTIALTTVPGTAPSMPAGVRAEFSDGIIRNAAVTWETIDPAKYAKRGSFQVKGTVPGATDSVIATVTVRGEGDLTVNLGKDTGEFMGGASGSLYGLYGEDVPNSNLVDGINLRTVATKAQDGPQHPGADALEILPQLAEASDGDVYIYMTDINRGFPYQWPGDTCEAKISTYLEKIRSQAEQVKSMPAELQDNVVFAPFNEPEGNMFGTEEWSCNKVSWLNNPDVFFDAWNRAHAIIKDVLPEARIGGPNTSILYNQVEGFLKHTVASKTVPDVTMWHELSDPASIRKNVAKYRGMEDRVFAGTEYEGTNLPINISEYAHNYHTSVPGQMVQWISSIEDSKVDADLAYWNIDGNLNDSAVEANRGNGQWWLLNAYTQMSGNTVEVVPPNPNVSYTLQGLATLDEKKQQSRVLFGGKSGGAFIQVNDVPESFGRSVHAVVKEIPWTGQLGDSAEPREVGELELTVSENGSVGMAFGEGDLPALKDSSAYYVVLSPGGNVDTTMASKTLWNGTFEAEDAAFTGEPRFLNGPEGSPSNLWGFFTSNSRDVGGLRTGSSLELDFKVTVPEAGTYDLSIFGSSWNRFEAVQEQGPTNVFLRVNDAAEQELFMPLGYKWVVWDHEDTKVELKAGENTISLAAKGLEGGATKGDVIIDKIDLSLPNPEVPFGSYEAEFAELSGTTPDYSLGGVSGAGGVPVVTGSKSTFWVYSDAPGEKTLRLDAIGKGQAKLLVNDAEVAGVSGATELPVFLRGGVNKVELMGATDGITADRLVVLDTKGALETRWVEAEDGKINGSAEVRDLSLASGSKAIAQIGGEPGNTNTLEVQVEAERAGTQMITVRYSNPEQSPSTHYNPDPLARFANVSVNGAKATRVGFPHSFHENNFWELEFPVELKEGTNTLVFQSEEKPNFDGKTYASDTNQDLLLRSRFAPVIDKIGVTPLVAASEPADTVAPTVALTLDKEANEAGWHTESPLVTIEATDEVDTDPKLEYSVNESDWQAYGEPLRITEQGEVEVAARATDAAGNVSEVVTATFKIDTAAPKVSHEINPTSQHVTLSAEDGVSGLALLEYRLVWPAGANGQNTDWAPYDGVIKPRGKDARVEIRATDKAGNIDKSIIEISRGR